MLGVDKEKSTASLEKSLRFDSSRWRETSLGWPSLSCRPVWRTWSGIMMGVRVEFHWHRGSECFLETAHSEGMRESRSRRDRKSLPPPPTICIARWWWLWVGFTSSWISGISGERNTQGMVEPEIPNGQKREPCQGSEPELFYKDAGCLLP